MEENKKGTAATKAKNKYNAQAYDRLYPYVKKGRKAVYEEAATNAGMTLNEFITEAIEEKVANKIYYGSKKEEILTIDELCDYIKSSKQAINQLCREGMPHYKVGTVMRFDKVKVDEWLKTK